MRAAVALLLAAACGAVRNGTRRRLASGREVVVVPVGGRASACAKQRVLALATSCGRDVVVLAGEEPDSWASSAWTTVPQATFPAAGDGAQTWRTFAGHRSGKSKPAFVRWFAASAYDYAWHVEEDAFFTGAWRRLFDAAAASAADVVAPWLRERALGAWHKTQVDHCHVYGQPCFRGREFLTQTAWPATRLGGSRSLEDGLASGRVAGHHEATTALFCREALKGAACWNRWTAGPSGPSSSAAKPRAEAWEDVPPPAQASEYTLAFAAYVGPWTSTASPGPSPRRSSTTREVRADRRRRGRGGVGGHGRAAGRPRRGPRRGGAAGLCGARARRLVVPAGEPDVARGAGVRRRGARTPSRLLVTGAGSSGTLYVAKLLRRSGLGFSHDDWDRCPCPGRDGAVSWVHAFSARTVAAAGGPRTCPGPSWSWGRDKDLRFDAVVHLVRDPLKTIASARARNDAAHASRRVRVEDLTADPGAVARGLCADFLRGGAHCPDAAAFAAAAETLASDVNAHGRGTNRTHARKGWAARPGSKPFLDAVDRGRQRYGAQFDPNTAAARRQRAFRDGRRDGRRAAAKGTARRRKKKKSVVGRQLNAVEAQPVTWASLRALDADVAALARNQARRYAGGGSGEADDQRDAGLEPRCGWTARALGCWLVGRDVVSVVWTPETKPRARAEEYHTMLRTLIALALLGGAEANGRHDANGDVIASLAPEELAVSASGHLGDRPPSYDMWSTGDRSGPPPYPYPADRTYNTKGGPKEGMINVHLVPHTHDDTGGRRRTLKRDRMKKLVAGKQLEFINGGWCMHDEASPLWTAMVDQTTRGHQFLLKHFGPEANPRGTWQIDPFGHSNTEAWLLGAEAGMESLFWGRMDYEDRDMRFGLNQTSSTPEKPTTGGFEWIWEGSKSLGASAQVFAGNLYGTGQGGYSTWMNFDGSDDQINDDPRRHDYNVDQWVDKFVQDARAQAEHTLTDHQLWACGTDFQYQNADHWFRNLDKLMHYVNLNGSVNAFYSTPTIYTEWKHKNKSVVYEVRTDDIFPLADNAHDYWSGYFTSRPALKRQGTVGVATHHDGMSGTERQDVTDDYEQRISESSFEVEAGVAASLAKLLKVDGAAIAHCNCNAAGDCLNMTVCAATTDATAGFTIAAFNPLGQAQDAMLRIPVGVAEEKAKLANKAVQVLAIRASLPAVGLTTLSCAPTPAAPRYALSDPPVTVADNADGTTTVANGFLELTFADKALVSLKNLDAGISTTLTATWGWYNSSVGGCTDYPDYLPKDILEPPCSGQASGAYMFRPNSSKLFGFDPAFEPTMEVEKGALVAEVRLASADWASHVVRLRAGARHVEVEWTAGPIPVDTPWFPPVAFENGNASKPLPNNWGKELVLKYASDLASAETFYTDSNGKEMVKRVRDARGPSYPHPTTSRSPSRATTTR
ncbi:hypothetical protein JL722_11590 [Aureococcus anophagefferens]|nr:hypothetical protein JL722_11590 [Aureococcus anophagefferens]